MLGHGEDDRWLGAQRCHAKLGTLVANLYFGNVIQQERRPPYPLHYRAAYLIHIVCREHSADDVFVAILIECATRSILVHARYHLHHLAQRHIIVHHLLRAEQYLILLHLTAKHSYLCHTARSEQAWTDGPVGQGAEVLERSFF